VTRPVLFHGGRIHVGDGSSAEALLARDGLVSALGSAKDLRREGSDAELVDLRGGLVVPGWVDAHVHFIWWALQMSQLDLRETKSLDEALANVAAYARRLPEGAWILGGRFDKNVWGKLADGRGPGQGHRRTAGSAAQPGRPLALGQHRGAAEEPT
jgi:predicted amidohydrolase YtcJ